MLVYASHANYNTNTNTNSNTNSNYNTNSNSNTKEKTPVRPSDRGFEVRGKREEGRSYNRGARRSQRSRRRRTRKMMPRKQSSPHMAIHTP